MFLMYYLEGGSFRFPLGLPHHNSYLTEQRTNVGVTLLRVPTANCISSNHTLEDWGDDCWVGPWTLWPIVSHQT